MENNSKIKEMKTKETNTSQMKDSFKEPVKDFFEFYEEMPQEVQKVIEKYSEDTQLAFGDFLVMQEALNDLGWDCDYCMDGSVVDLKPITFKVVEDMEPMTGDSWITVRVSNDDKVRYFHLDCYDSYQKYVEVLKSRGYIEITEKKEEV